MLPPTAWGSKSVIAVMSAARPLLPRGADIHPRSWYVADVPRAAMSRCSNGRTQKVGLLDHRIGERLWNARRARLFRLDVGGADHLGPLFRFGGQPGVKLGRAQRQWDGGQFRQSRFDYRSHEAGVDLAVKSFNDSS